LPVHVLGGGSNTIFDDAGFEGLVLHVALIGIDIETRGQAAIVTAAAGEDWDGLVQRCIAADLSGIECLSGIPGSVGATPMQNVGAYGQEVAETIVEVEAIERATGAERVFAAADCGFGYRTSRFKGADRDRYLITRVVYRLPHRQPPEIRYPELARSLEAGAIDLAGLDSGREASVAVREAVLTLRRAKSMILDEADPHSRSAGSFFLNPVLTDAQLDEVRRRWVGRGQPAGDVPAFPTKGGHKVPAAWLVERSGFTKGYRRGGVGISQSHALALVNYDGASADLLALSEEVMAAVSSAFGVRLEREPVYVPPHGGGDGGG
jgi:UDP-N-acetylmuramate dehydrogenase